MKTRFYVEYARHERGWRVFDTQTGALVGRGVQNDLALKSLVRFLNNYCGVTSSARHFVLGLLNVNEEEEE